MIEEKKILTKIDEMNGYLEELEKIKPVSIEEYKDNTEKKRACERLLQISIETVIDICNILASSQKIGLPEDEDALLDKLQKKNILSISLTKKLRSMKGFRNILVHKYGEVDDEISYENLEKLSDFDLFKEEVIFFLKK